MSRAVGTGIVAIRSGLSGALRMVTIFGVVLFLVGRAPLSPESRPHPLGPVDLAAAGVPAAPTVVYTEDFENGMNLAVDGAKSLTSNGLGAPVYASATAGLTYTADTNWREGQRCDGIVLAYANGDDNRVDGGGPAWATTGQFVGATQMLDKCSPSNGVQSYNGIRTLARALGSVVGGGDQNHIVSSYTECAQDAAGSTTNCNPLSPIGPTSSRMFETQPPVAVTANRFYTFAVDAVAGNCSGTGTATLAGDPLYQFQLVSGATRVDVGSALNPCRDNSRTAFTVNRPRSVGGSVGTMSGYVSRLRADTAFMYAGSMMGVAMYNASGVTLGNDGGFDNVRVLDVSPTVDKSFTPKLLEPGQTSTLTFTVTNTTDLLAKSDWGFVDSLPAGLTLASTTFGGTCAQAAGTSAFTKSGVVGGNTFTVTGGDLALNQTSCTVTAQVTSSTENSYTNSPSANMTLSGLKPGAPDSVEFRRPRVVLTKALATARVKTEDQFQVAIRTGSGAGPVVSSTSGAVSSGSGSTITTGSGTTGTYVGAAGTTYYLTEAASGTTDLSLYDATVTCLDATGATTGLPTNAPYTVSNAITPAIGANISCIITNRATQPTIKLTKALGSPRVADTDQFVVGVRTGSATGPVVSSPAASTTAGSGSAVSAGTGTTGNFNATAGTAYFLTESPAGSTNLSDYSKSITCTDASGVQPNLPVGAPFSSALQITPVAGARISCILTNSVARFDVYLEKQSNDHGSWVPTNGSSWELRADSGGIPGATLTSPTVSPVSGQTGTFVMTQMLPGTFWLTETKAPGGQSLLAEPVRFTVSAQGIVTIGSGGAANTVAVGQTAGGAPLLVVRNYAALELPEAGGSGSGGLGVGGLATLGLALVMVVCLAARRRRATGV